MDSKMLMAQFKDEIATLQAEIKTLKERPVLRKSPFRVVLTEQIPSKRHPGKVWASLEVTEDGNERKFFVDKVLAPTKRPDGAITTVIFASPMLPEAPVAPADATEA